MMPYIFIRKIIYIKIHEKEVCKTVYSAHTGDDILLISSRFLLREVSHKGKCLDHRSETTYIEYQDIGYWGKLTLQSVEYNNWMKSIGYEIYEDIKQRMHIIQILWY